MAPPIKRKRPNEDADDDEVGLGLRQILPVANLPVSFDGEPIDGLQYLFMVRRDARRLPHTTRVVNPYELAEQALPLKNSLPEEREKLELPTEEWRTLFERRFRNFRSNVSQPVIRPPAPPQYGPGSQNKIMPDKKNRDAWWAFLEGAPESVWNPPRVPKNKTQGPRRSPEHTGYGRNPDDGARGMDVSGESSRSTAYGTMQAVPMSESSPTPAVHPPTLKPREPLPALLQNIDHRLSVHLLMYFTHWFNLYLDSLPPPPAPESAGNLSVSDTPSQHLPTDVHARWIFALLARVDAFCTADEISGLRALVRACLALARVRRTTSAAREFAKSTQPSGDIEGESKPHDATIGVDIARTEVAAVRMGAEIVSESSLWMIVCAVASIWGQRDLWVDAEGS